MRRRSRKAPMTAAVLAALGSGLALAAHQPTPGSTVDAAHWGWITAPFYDLW
jgi:hypothetical protein